MEGGGGICRAAVEAVRLLTSFPSASIFVPSTHHTSILRLVVLHAQKAQQVPLHQTR
jgi:hypothetical protein